MFFDAHETEIGMLQEDCHPKPTPSGPKVISKRDPDYDQLHPYFGWSAADLIKKDL
jgi:hypothetical protein